MEANTKVGAGRFTLVRPLGRGGMGEVWLAQDERLHEQVALKFLPAEIRSDETALDDLRRETARSHRLTHSNIVRIHDLHEEPGGLAFIAMEYVDGPTLASLRLQQADRVLGWQFLQPLVQQLCAALEYAHGEKVIHRDLKPANMMLDSRGRLKLADFGIAATVSDSVSRISLRHASSGTLAYMSPQQLAGKRPQVTDDIYALGATLYELLTSKPPFYTGDITHQVLHEMPEPLNERLAAVEIQNDIPPDAAALVMACLAKEPAQRPQSAAAVAGWVGLETAKQPAREDLAGTMFPEMQSEGRGAAAESVRVAEPASRVGGSKRVLVPIAVATAVLLAGIGVWQIAKRRSGNNQPSQSVTHGDSPAAGQSAAVNESGFMSLFNGSDLSGWDGDSKIWSVKDGAITAHISGAVKPTNYFLVRRDLTATDFELRALCRFIGGSPAGPYPGNLGVAYRGKDVGDRDIHGYQFDLQSDAFRFPGTGAIGEMHAKGRKTLAKVGQKTVAWPGGGADEFQVVGTASAKEEVFAGIKKNDWNELVIIARSNHITHQINGVTTAELTDNNESRRALSGLVALKLYFYEGPTITGQFKDIRLKRLAPSTSSQPQRQPPSIESGFVSLFNGRDLSGWDGDPRFWSVEGGAIKAETTAGNVPEGNNSYLLWTNGVADDFELHISYKLVAGDQGSGVQYRGRTISRWVAQGYQVDFWPVASGNSGLLANEAPGGNGRPGFGRLAAPGEKVVWGADGKKQVIGRTAKSPAEIQAAIKEGDWNECVVIGRGNHLFHQINGNITMEMTDNDAQRRFTSGLIGLKVRRNQGKPMLVYFKDIFLKRLAESDAQNAPVAAGGVKDTSTGNQLWTNSLGMRFRQPPGTKVLFSVWETRVQDFESFVKSTGYDATSGMLSLKGDGWKMQGDRWNSPGFSQSATYPVCGVSWDDAQAFCAWLTKREQQSGKLSEHQRYRLPTDAEWSAAAGTGKYPWGEQWPPITEAGNYASDEVTGATWPASMKHITGRRDNYARTAAVGSFRANQNGFYDMGGNVWEWCEDWYQKSLNSEENRRIFGGENDGGGNQLRVLRGASWKNGSSMPEMQIDFRAHERPVTRRDNNGFRCVLVTNPPE